MQQLPLRHALHPDSAGLALDPIGYGTYKVDPQVAADLVFQAIEVGYRHIDTAQMYENETGVGAGIARAIAAGLVQREDLFITTKLDNPNHAPEVAERTFSQSLQDLGLEYVDLFLIHWPLPQRRDPHFVQVWSQLLGFMESGRARAVGVSNFEIEHIELLQAETGILPALNQIEIHPSFLNSQVATWCQEQGIVVEAWSPLGRQQDLSLPGLIEVAEQCQATPAQVALAAAMARGQSVIPKASSPVRMAENLAAAQLQLTPAQLHSLQSLDRGEAGRISAHPNDRN